MPIFEPPVTRDWTFADGARTAGDRRYWSYYGTQPRGRSVLKIAGTWTSLERSPTTAEINATTHIINPEGQLVPGYFSGGHIYQVTQTVANELIAAGHTVTADPAATDLFTALFEGTY